MSVSSIAKSHHAAGEATSSTAPPALAMRAMPSRAFRYVRVVESAIIAVVAIHDVRGGDAEQGAIAAVLRAR
jgi:hypothetical protein